MLHGSYDLWLVAASLLMAMLASYTALSLTSRVFASRGHSARFWLFGGAFAMGTGIWSMHFLGMLAFRLPMRVGYDLGITLLSALIAIASSLFALWTECRQTLTPPRLIANACIMGAGICGMHYTGMAAMRMDPAIHYISSLVIASIAIAVIASAAALWIAFRLRSRTSHIILSRLAASIVMGIAIAGMHYTGMAAAQFPIGSVCRAQHLALSRYWLALVILVVALFVLSIVLVMSFVDFRYQLRTGWLYQSLDTANSELRFLALHDSLTRLPNRSLLEDRLEHQIRQAARQRSVIAVFFMDLDEFKHVNDAYGHHAGDDLLVQIARRVGAAIRASDTFARMGGDEFVLLASVSDPMEAASLADKVLAVIREPVQLEQQTIWASASIGIALSDGHSDRPSDLLRKADAAMYHAKRLGRNGYCFFNPSMRENEELHLGMLNDMREAVQRNQLTLYFQPKFCAATGEVVGAEALLRWMHPTLGLLTPDRFIPVAEETGAIFQIGRWVINEACRQVSRWHAAGHWAWGVSVNLSAMEFNHPGMVEMVRDALDRHGVAPHNLTVEITETTAMNDVDASLLILQALSDMGVRVSIDDFGTGYSSLLYLKRFPASELKIDRAFVRNLENDPQDAAIVASIVALGGTLSLKVVAEGVETVAQRDYLSQIGCDSLQGYYLGYPMPAEQLLLLPSVWQTSSGDHPAASADKVVVQ